MNGGDGERTGSRFDVLTQGVRLGRYEILGRIAVGGMAELYLAGVEGFRKLVVIKRILPDLMDNEEYVRMFLDEARLLARLGHPNIVEVYDIESARGEHFYAMEYVHGESAQRLMAACRCLRREIPYDQAVAIAIGVAAGLHHAHDASDVDGQPLGIVHRDVSPSNILITFSGAVKVVDFGVAKARVRQSPTTRVGTLKGKVSYMSPEQCRGEEVDRRSDVFAIGIVLYELTTGARPFQADSDLGVVKKILETRPPPPLLVRSGYPERLERIVMRALSPAPEDRQQSADELRRELEELATDEAFDVSPAALASFVQETFGSQAGTIERESSSAYFAMSLHMPPATRSTRGTTVETTAPRSRKKLILPLAAVSLFGLAGAVAVPRTGGDEVPPAASVIIARPLPVPVPPPGPPPAPVAPQITPAASAPAPAVTKRPRRRKAIATSTPVSAPPPPSAATTPTVGPIGRPPPRFGHF